MSLLDAFFTWRQFQRSQWLDREALVRLQRKKLRAVVEHAYRFVPYYRELFDGAGVRPEQIRSPEDLGRIPISSKRALQEAGPEAITSGAYRAGALVSERTSGSSGRPFTVRTDPHWSAVRKALFLRVLWTAGYRPGSRLMMLAGRRGRRWLPGTGWHYIAFEEPAERVLAKVNRLRPSILYGWVTPLVQLADHVRSRGDRVHAPRAVITTAEGLSDDTRRFLEQTLDAEVYDMYGLTEMGVVAWECDRHDGYHLSEDSCLVEFVAGADGAPRLVMTNLEMTGTPFLRFETGDLGVRGPAAPCACGRSLARLERIEGREIDCVELRGGRVISPYRLTLAVEQVPGVRRYQVVQEGADRLLIRYETADEETGPIDEALREAIGAVVGEDVRIEARRSSGSRARS